MVVEESVRSYALALAVRFGSVETIVPLGGIIVLPKELETRLGKVIIPKAPSDMPTPAVIRLGSVATEVPVIITAPFAIAISCGRLATIFPLGVESARRVSTPLTWLLLRTPRLARAKLLAYGLRRSVAK